jgi:hypothetical protein
MPRALRIGWRCLLFGATINLLIAWALSWQAQRREAPKALFLGSGGTAYRQGDGHRPIALETWWSAESCGRVRPLGFHFDRSWQCAEVEIVAALATSSNDGAERWDVLQTIDAGWPLPSFIGTSWTYGEVLRTNLREPLHPFHMRLLPIAPIWPGLFNNVALFAGLPFVLIELPLIARDFVRGFRAKQERRRGRCPECQYDLRGDVGAGCPECGWGRE